MSGVSKTMEDNGGKLKKLEKGSGPVATLQPVSQDRQDADVYHVIMLYMLWFFLVIFFSHCFSTFECFFAAIFQCPSS